MEELFKLLIGVVVLLLGFPIGNFLAKHTQEELKAGKVWFKLLMVICLIGGIVGLFLKNDVLMFSLFFIAIVSSRSLK